MSIMTSAATVYAGPSLSGAYPSIGQIQKDRAGPDKDIIAKRISEPP